MIDWKKAKRKILSSDNKQQKEKKRKENINDIDQHDFILMTDTENFVDENLEVIEGFHHLSKVDQATPYKTEKVEFVHTALEKRIQEDDYDQFVMHACQSFQILRDRAHVFINLLQLMLVSDIDELQQKDIKYLIDAMFLDMSDE